MTIRITLDYPPSANRYWRYSRGHFHRSDEADNYIEYAKWICKTADIQKIEGPVSIRLKFYRPAQRGDLDNMLKVLLDALQGSAYANDNQIVEINALRFEDKHHPRVELEIAPL